VAAVALSIGMPLATWAQTEPAKATEKYTQNERDTIVAATPMPVDVEHGYRLFRAKCASCHTLNRLTAKTGLSATEWEDIVVRMRDMASSHTNEEQATAILRFVIWNDRHRKETK